MDASPDIRGMLRVTYWWSNPAEGSHSETIASLDALCPACGFEHAFRVDLEGHGKWTRQTGEPDVWTFDGNWDAPTFQPSMLSHANPAMGHPVCHSFVENGERRYLSDCTHEMVGQTVPMIPPDPSMTWKQRHGWPTS